MNHLSCLLLGLSAGLLISLPVTRQDQAAAPKAQELIPWAKVEAAFKEKGGAWQGLLDRPSLSTGVYRLSAGAEDGQSPHRHDEVYYIIKGKATLTAGDQELPMQPGSIAYVARDVPHRFHQIEEDLEVLVFFSKYAPPK